MKIIPAGTPLPEDVWVARHRLIVGFLALHVPAVVAVALWNGWTIGHTLAEISPIVALTIGAAFLPNRSARELCSILGLIITAMVFIHVTGGIVEAHFHAFIVIPTIAAYQRWASYLLVLVFASIHHVGLAVVNPTVLIDHLDTGENPWPWVVVHLLAVGVLAAVMVVFWAQIEDAQDRARQLIEEQANAERARAAENEARAQAVRDGAQRLATISQDSAENVDAIARSLDELTQGAAEIASSAEAVSHSGQNALARAKQTETTVERLTAASAEIDDVMQLITAVAKQTNLLALNATIEAARAGEAGKGFAVVASEVKDLAARTTTATDEVARRVETIQAESTDASGAIADIGTIIAEIVDMQATVAGAVEQQTHNVASISARAESANSLSQSTAAEAASLST
ncbi:MAG: methyl-accepting chemotaxis protein [Actinomycetota bacterium]